MKITKEQQVSLKRIYDRIKENTSRLSFLDRAEENISYLSFRRKASLGIGLGNAIVIPFSRMFLVIETDGYTHS